MFISHQWRLHQVGHPLLVSAQLGTYSIILVACSLSNHSSRLDPPLWAIGLSLLLIVVLCFVHHACSIVNNPTNFCHLLCKMQGCKSDLLVKVAFLHQKCVISLYMIVSLSHLLHLFVPGLLGRALAYRMHGRGVDPGHRQLGIWVAFVQEVLGAEVALHFSKPDV